MYVRYYMTSSPLTIGPRKTIEEARQLLQNYNFRHLPVVDESGCLLGMVTDRDLRSAYPSSVLKEDDRRHILARIQETPVSSIMSSDNAVLNEFSTLDDALLIFEKRSVGALPVIDGNGKVVGIFSSNDLLKAWRSLFGLGEKGSALITIEMQSDVRFLSRLVALLEELDVPFTRLVRTDGSGREPAMLYLRINTYNIRAVRKVIEKAGFKVHQPEFDPEIS
ncbi:MAG TPA: CBS domain-containing protein [Desulfobacteraceae bacterium]|nr:CBS domain-containing protein [Desulfobacteraceae bacterium]